MISRAFGEGSQEERDTAFMDWDLKTPSWDFLDFDRESGHNIASLVGSNCIGEQKPRGDCSVDLKLGRLGDLGDGALNKWKDPRDSPVLSSSSSPLSSAKRPRIPATGIQVVSCLVDGCTADLSKCRDYHRRHKVCEAHSKTPRVMVGGQEQRFCQQCSRFHTLGEFDEVKRSCRKRLDGHNRRRRKPQPDMNSGSLFPHHQGTRLLPFTNPQVRPSTSVMNSNWKAVVKTEEDMLQYNGHPSLHLVDRQPLFSGSFSGTYKREKQFPFLPANNHVLGHQTAVEASVCQPLLNTISCSSQNASGASRKMFSDGLSRVLDSDCALSLLSSPPTQSSGINMSHLVQPDSIPIAQPLVPGLQYTSLCGYPSEGIESEQMGTVLVSDANDSEIHCHGIYNVGPGSSQNEVQQRLPFSWE